jgi:hypothetical protein
LKAHAVLVGVDVVEAHVQDLINDLAHWCDRHGVELFECWRKAESNYEAETDGKGAQFDAK